MQDPGAMADARERTRTVLLVEDEILTRVVAAEALRDAGFVVIEASSGDEAQALVASGLRPDVLFTDVRMPGRRDGLILARELKAHLPGLIVFVTSGHENPQAALALGHQFFPKPYNIDAVVRVIGETLEKHAG